MENLTQEQKKALIVIAGVGAVVLGILFYLWIALWKPAMASNEKFAEDSRKKIAELDRKLGDIRRIRALQDQTDQLKAKLDRVSKRLPSSPETSGFYTALSEILKSSGVLTRRLKADNRVYSSRYVEIPYTIEASGQYHEIGSFLNLVEENPERFMRVKKILIQNNPGSPSRHPATLTIATFMFVGE
ncbi:type 4a pilus biogenesis protein PilO [Candidatus Sumerlaeota bacterium]|nr:type 4a pilus biogenesis protein PilO [Candidatus Sumerlaeota bacterium]